MERKDSFLEINPKEDVAFEESDQSDHEIDDGENDTFVYLSDEEKEGRENNENNNNNSEKKKILQFQICQIQKTTEKNPIQFNYQNQIRKQMESSQQTTTTMKIQKKRKKMKFKFWK